MPNDVDDFIIEGEGGRGSRVGGGPDATCGSPHC